jgi:ectoine hydroxylase-related dioxygenase (phytanoyl-CoA dioxygenase family)
MQLQQNYLSPFGGFWTDTRESRELLARLRDERNMTAEEADLLAFWIANGYAIIPGALDAAGVQRTRAAIDRMIDSGSRQMTYWAPDGKHQHEAQRDKLAAGECKILDVHSNDADVQRAIFAPKIARFLELVMGAKATAFQTLYFEYGSEQGLHQDTAFVYVDPPLEFVASWLALEDITSGSGELVFYAGSHRLPDELFGDPPGKALFGNDPKARTYSRDLEQRCKDASMKLEHFVPKAGDVLFWAADLVHGGAPRQSGSTRRSLVTHYCPLGRRPPYASDEMRPTILGDGNAVLSAT